MNRRAKKISTDPDHAGEHALGPSLSPSFPATEGGQTSVRFVRDDDFFRKNLIKVEVRDEAGRLVDGWGTNELFATTYPTFFDHRVSAGVLRGQMAERAKALTIGARSPLLGP